MQPAPAPVIPAKAGIQSLCFHCDLPIASGARFGFEHRGEWRRFCCAGCEAVSGAISAGGFDDYYRLRTGSAPRPDEARPDEAAIYDDPAVQSRFVRTLADGSREAELVIEGMRCAACAWLVERSLARIEGVMQATVNATTRRALVRVSTAPMSSVIRAVVAVGYAAWPYEPRRAMQASDAERRSLLRRLWVAGLGMMQVMMYAIPAYMAGAGEITADAASLMRWAGLVLTLPVVLFSAAPMFAGAVRELRALRPGMDLPVALGIGVAFAASAWNTALGTGEVYFDSVTMFVFLLLGGRYLEYAARIRASRALDHLAAWMPPSATRLAHAHDTAGELVPASRLVEGDLVLVKPGETVPADGIVASAAAAVSEALLTGESHVHSRAEGDALVGGSVNAGAAFVLRVTRVGADTVLSSVRRLIERASMQRPPSVALADRAAGLFVLVVLAAAAAAFFAWARADAAHGLWIAVSVLIVTCPCALSLATPAALTAASGRLARGHVAIARAGAIEGLASVTHVVFDKTGTLTHGTPALEEVLVLDGASASDALAVAAAVGCLTSHPLDRAIVAAAPGSMVEAREHRIVPGQGAEALVGRDRVRLGRAAFAAELAGSPAPFITLPGASSVVWLAREGQWIAAFRLGDRVRAEAHRAIERLRGLGIAVSMLSGDGEAAAQRAARALGVTNVCVGATPERKALYVTDLQARGATVAMVGDGINDAPVLALADVSVAMGAGAVLAQSQADAVLLSNSIEDLARAVETARATRRVIRQNLAWALGYNAIAVPLALAGLVTPLIAGIGMSASSLVVVVNGLRLARREVA